MKFPFFSKNKTSNAIKIPESKVAGKKASKTVKSSGKKAKVIVYSTKTCPWCKKTKEFLKANKIPFTSKDVGSSSKNAGEMFKKSGQQGVPVTDIGGKIIIGFNEGKLKSALGL